MRLAAIAILGAALMLAGPTAGAETDRHRSLPPPVAQDITITISADQEGQTVRVPAGQRFAVALVGVPTAGYLWQPWVMAPFLTRAGEASGATTSAQRQPGFTGGNHWEVFYFAAVEPGEGDLVLVQRRPWETDEPPTEAFRVRIVAE